MRHLKIRPTSPDQTYASSLTVELVFKFSEGVFSIGDFTPEEKTILFPRDSELGHIIAKWNFSRTF